MVTRLDDRAGGGASYSRWLIDALKQVGVEIETTSRFMKTATTKERIIHLQHEPLFFGYLKSVLFPFLVMILHFRGKKIVITYHGVFNQSLLNFYAKERYPHLQWLAKITVNFIFNLSSKYGDFLIVHSEALGAYLKAQYPKVKNKIRVIHHGIITRYRKNQVHPIKTISMFGFFGEHQSNDLLIEASKYLADIHFNVTSDWVDNLDDFLCDTDLFVFPENNRVSTSGVLLIAIGYGIPVLVYDDPVFRNLGLTLFQSRNPKVLAALIEKVISDTDLLSKLNHVSHELAERDSWLNIARQTKQVYEEPE